MHCRLYFDIYHNKSGILAKYLDKTKARIAAIFEATNTELNVRQIKAMR